MSALYPKHCHLKSASLKIEPLQYIAMYCDGSIFNETDFNLIANISLYALSWPKLNFGSFEVTFKLSKQRILPF